MEKNDFVNISIEDMTEEGMGIGHVDNMAVFVKDTCPGDVAEIRIVKVKKTYAFGRLERLISPSEYRIDPKCPVAKQCGGCTLQHISYEKELELKKNRVSSCLQRIGGIENPDQYLEQVCGMEVPERYRNKMQFPVSRRDRGNVYGGENSSLSVFSCKSRTVLGFYAGRTHSLIPVKDCVIGHEVNKYISDGVIRWADNYQISIYDEERGQGLLRHVLTRVGFRTGQLMVCIVVTSKKVPYTDKLVAELSKQVEKYKSDHPDEEFRLRSVVMNINKEKTNKILGDKTILINGQDYITDYIGDIKFHISAQSFYQVNPKQTVRLYSKVLEYAELTGKETVWDMYCGIGTISLFLAKSAGKVYGVEVVPQAIEDARDNASLNDIENVEFFVGKAEDVVTNWYNVSGKSHIDVVVVDPPRKGCDEKLLETIVDMKPDKMIYVSCDPATLARDLKYLLSNGFNMEKYSVYDQFSRSMHVETVVLLDNKKARAKDYVEIGIDAEDYYRIKGSEKKEKE
ncbi:MAG: 23S rRNA (uracil(1939)-C(5))-methyltransferase RlmD [Eubacterium sp.]|nr:23S rRNA (uracil(1939)-C(5))-methyltransferase RlmD [Eubacterium sp.]